MAQVDVLIPTYNRVCAVGALLTSLYYQTWQDFRIVVSDQADTDELFDSPTIQTIVRMHSLHHRSVELVKHLPRRGIAEQRNFLFSHATAPYTLFLDDDLILEPDVIAGMVQVLQEQQCGFVGRAVIGLSFMHDVRPHQQAIEFWDGRVVPEMVRPGSAEWQRYMLHNAANPLHIAQKYNITWQNPQLYKVAWVGGCCMYDTAKLRAVGGFSFWEELPREHCGEDVLAQLRVMARYGGCGVLPSGVYHQQLPTTLENRSYNAPEKLAIAEVELAENQ